MNRGKDLAEIELVRNNGSILGPKRCTMVFVRSSRFDSRFLFARCNDVRTSAIGPTVIGQDFFVLESVG